MNTEQAFDKAQSSMSGVTDKVMSWIEDAISLLPNLVVAFIVLVLFVLLANMVGRLTRRGLHRASKNGQVTSLATSVIRTLVLATGVFVALGVLGLDKAVSSLLAGVGILGLAVGFAFQDMLANVMAGILLAFRRPFELGEMVETNGVNGNVERSNLSATLIRTFQGQLVWIPNKDVLSSVLTNYSRLGMRRVEVAVGVSYGDDLDLAENTCREVLESLDFRDTTKSVDVWYTGFGGSSIDISARLWIDLSGTVGYLKARSEVIKALKAGFDEAGLTIPFPIRTMDFGIAGGQSLKEQIGDLSHSLQTMGSTHAQNGAKSQKRVDGTPASSNGSGELNQSDMRFD